MLSLKINNWKILIIYQVWILYLDYLLITLDALWSCSILIVMHLLFLPYGPLAMGHVVWAQPPRMKVLLIYTILILFVFCKNKREARLRKTRFITSNNGWGTYKFINVKCPSNAELLIKEPSLNYLLCLYRVHLYSSHKPSLI